MTRDNEPKRRRNPSKKKDADFKIEIRDVSHLYDDREANEFADILGITDANSANYLLSMVRLTGELYVKRKYHNKKRHKDADLPKIEYIMSTLASLLQNDHGLSATAHDHLNYMYALEEKIQMNRGTFSKDEFTATITMKNLLGESRLGDPNNPDETDERYLYSKHDMGMVLNTSQNHFIDALENTYKKVEGLKNMYEIMHAGSKSRSEAEFFAIDVLITIYKDFTGTKGGRSNRVDESGPEGRLLAFVEKVLVRLRPPGDRHKRLDHALKEVIAIRKNSGKTIVDIKANT
jgi:hypothetical protein